MSRQAERDAETETRRKRERETERNTEREGEILINIDAMCKVWVHPDQSAWCWGRGCQSAPHKVGPALACAAALDLVYPFGMVQCQRKRGTCRHIPAERTSGGHFIFD